MTGRSMADGRDDDAPLTERITDDAAIGGVPEDADEDVPPEEARSDDAPRGNDDVTLAERRHRWRVEDYRNTAAGWVVGVSLAAIAAAYLIAALRNGDNDALDRMADAFKLIGTTALGYLFGRASGSK